MKIFFRCAAFAPLLALVASCCANSANTCDDLQADSLFLVLKSMPDPAVPNDPSVFTASELDTVYIQRYSPAVPANNATTPVTPARPEGALSDPVSIIRARQATAINSTLRKTLRKANLGDSTLVISNTAPFSPSVTGGKLNAYNYLLTIQDKSTKVRPLYQYRIENIVLQGQYAADGCTTCYQNTKKTFQLRGKQTALKPVTETGGVPIPVYIGKLN